MAPPFPIDLFLPSAAYVDGADTLEHNQQEADEDWASRVEELLNDLEFDIEPEQMEDGTIPQATIKYQSGKRIKEDIRPLVELPGAHHDRMRHTLLACLVSDMDRQLGVLDTQEMAVFRSTLRVQDEWMEAILHMDACSNVLQAFGKKRNPDWWQWLLDGTSPLPLHGAKTGIIRAAEPLAQALLGDNKTRPPDEVVASWSALFARTKNAFDLQKMHSFWLVSYLQDPARSFARALDAQGFVFDVRKVNWQDAMDHGHRVAPGKSSDMIVRHAQTFVRRYLLDIARLDPVFAGEGPPPDMNKVVRETDKAKHVPAGRGLRGLLENIEKPFERAALLVALDEVVLSSQTPLVQTPRSTPRL